MPPVWETPAEQHNHLPLRIERNCRFAYGSFPHEVSLHIPGKVCYLYTNQCNSSALRCSQRAACLLCDHSGIQYYNWPFPICGVLRPAPVFYRIESTLYSGHLKKYEFKRLPAYFLKMKGDTSGLPSPIMAVVLCAMATAQV